MKLSLRPFLISIALFFAPFAYALELVMVEQAGCYYCKAWRKDIAPIYPKTELSKRASLRYIDIAEAPFEFELSRAVIFTPTFLLVDENGQELSRLEGYQSEDFFWALIEGQINAHSAQ